MRYDSGPIRRGKAQLVVVADDHDTGSTWVGEVHEGSADGPVLHTERARSQNDALKWCMDWINRQAW